MPYPPSSGVYAVYTTDDFFDAVNYAQEQVILAFQMKRAHWIALLYT